MKYPRFKICVIALFAMLAVVSCKKKEDKTPYSDYRDQYCGSYAVTFSVSADVHGNGTPYTVEKIVTIRKPEDDETSGDPAKNRATWITLTNLPFPGERTIPLKADGTADFSAHMNLQNGMFYSQWSDGAGSQSKLVLGKGTKI
jgi:hypothetical protein